MEMGILANATREKEERNNGIENITSYENEYDYEIGGTNAIAKIEDKHTYIHITRKLTMIHRITLNTWSNSTNWVHT